MRVENLRKNFMLLSPEEQVDFVAEYRKKREKDLTSVIPLPAKAANKVLNSARNSSGGKKEKKIAVTPEALEMLRALGLC